MQTDNEGVCVPVHHTLLLSVHLFTSVICTSSDSLLRHSSTVNPPRPRTRAEVVPLDVLSHADCINVQWYLCVMAIPSFANPCVLIWCFYLTPSRGILLFAHCDAALRMHTRGECEVMTLI